ncbi:MAG: DUF5596 domain-containing protein, partial [candidate division Zixibacteria bacterium]|nr:DUF5596 domain-containing protein [candidate division Zixibacteria bacterium]
AKKAGLPPDLCDAVVDGTRLFSEIPALMRLAWHVHYRLFVNKIEFYPRWPPLPDTLPDTARLFYVYPLLSQTPAILATHTRLRVDPVVSRDTLSDLHRWMEDYHRSAGYTGLDPHQVSWLALSFGGKLFQLGRLQFEFSVLRYDFNAYRRKTDGTIAVFAGPEMRFRADGSSVSRDETHEVWTTSFEADVDAIRGYRVCPTGFVETERTTLVSSQWERVLKKDDSTIAVHIPATGPMDFEACGRSFQQAATFFARTFPQFHPHAYTCASWLLDPRLPEFADPESNIVRFLKEWYLLPYPQAGEREALRRIFGVTERPSDPETFPRDTSLQRQTIAFLQNGGNLSAGLGLQFPHNMSWGCQVYQSQNG